MEFINREPIKHLRKRRARKTSFIKEYYYEITVLFLMGSGIFLLFEKMNIKSELLIIFKNILIFLKEIILSNLLFVAKVMSRIEISDLVGISLIIISIFLIFRRIRVRIIQRFNQLNDCPKCGEDLHRKRRTTNQKILSWIFFVKIMNYSCSKCDYNGLYVKINS